MTWIAMRVVSSHRVVGAGMNAAGLGTTIHFFANNSARAYGDEPFTLEELVALKVGLARAASSSPIAEVVASVNAPVVGNRGLRSLVAEALHFADRPARATQPEYIAAARALLTSIDDLQACADATAQRLIDERANAVMKTLTGRTQTIPTDPRAALCPR